MMKQLQLALEKIFGEFGAFAGIFFQHVIGDQYPTHRTARQPL